jgi:hypothetical protein
MTVKKQSPKSYWTAGPRRSSRASLRMSDDLRRALEFLAAAERRTLSQYLEITVLEKAKYMLRNEFDATGKLLGNNREFEFKNGKDPRLVKS